MKILELSAIELAKKIKAGEITSEEAAKASLAQIAKEDQKIRAYLTVDEEKVLARAKEVDNGILLILRHCEPLRLHLCPR